MVSLRRINLSDEFWRGVKDHVLELLTGDILQSGVAVVRPGERYPPQGFSSHPESDELSFMISGTLRFCTDREELILRPGDLLLNPKGTPHYIENIGNEEVRVLWVLAPKIRI
ncbi:MAG: cupin domain-containing protein [Candidatus Korarchaeota archaeon NZ13-K]|nr:MAG: cupin domain-containing protein [Candidatus Korarchaeota archaeon NZ13-K]